MKLTITRPDDWHLHLRDNSALTTTVPHIARTFNRAIIMPNLRPPITTTEDASAYRQRILAALPRESSFQPLMTLYLTDNTSTEDIESAKQSGIVHAVKLYPAGATTHSDAGVTRLEKTYGALTKMEELGLPLLIHGEVTDPDVDIFDREKFFIDQQLIPLVAHFPRLNIVLEHITTKDAVDYITDASDNVAATITAHHLLLNRNAMLVGGIQAHHYCLPVLKREAHRQALVAAATSDNPKFFLGTDSAPHPRSAKETACGCAGVYTAHAAIELYTEAFEAAGALDRLEAFASFRGADFYGLPRNQDTITLTKEPWTVPPSYHFADEQLIPLRAGQRVLWQVMAS